MNDAAAAEMPIFTKTYDFLAWLVPTTNNFPRAHRYAATQRLLDAAFSFLERAVEANNVRGGDRLRLLIAAGAELDKVRLYLRLAHTWHWMNDGQYEHSARMVAELGRLLGGWQNATRQSPGGAGKDRGAR